MSYDPTQLAAIGRAEEYNASRYHVTTNPYGFAGDGYKGNIPSAMNDMAIIANAVAEMAVAAEDSATAAANVVANAMETTSTTSFNLASSTPTTKVFTTADNLDTVAAFVDGMSVQGVSQSDMNKYFLGAVISATANTLTLSITETNGSGTHTDWSIFACGKPGKTVLNFDAYSTVTIDPANDLLLLKDVSGNVPAKVTLDSALNTAKAIRADVTDELEVGYTVASYNAGTKTSGTFTPDPALRGLQYAINGGAHTLAAPADDCSLVIKYTNNATAGAVTFSGFDKVNGSFSTTEDDVFMCYIVRVDGTSHLTIVRM